MYPDSNTIIIPGSKGAAIVDIRLIIRIEAVSNYSRVFLADGRKFILSKVLKQMEEMLEGKGFARVHRSHLVNTACIRSYNLYQLKVLLNNKEEVSISRRRGRDMRKRLFGQKAA
jgi:two-component system, LytTR family, response regulator